MGRHPKAHIAALQPYVPGKPIEEVERELGIHDSVKLASNENPLGPSPKAVEAIRRAAGQVNRYPDGACFRLREALATRLGVDPEQLVFSCGGDELLELVAKPFVGEGDEVIFPWPSFAMYPIYAQGLGAQGVRVPLGSDLALDLQAMARAVTERTRLVYLCNPNNPTGTSVGAADFDRFLEALPEHVVLLIDEAYVEYARRGDFPDSLAWVQRRPGTVVLRTFSKIYGLAGLRVGYGVMDPQIADLVHRVRHPFNVNLIAEEAALAALDDQEHVERSRQNNEEGIAFFERELPALGVEVTPTDANFVLVRPGEGAYEALLRQGVIVRPMQGFGLPEHVRITVGTPEENEKLVKALARFREGLSR